MFLYSAVVTKLTSEPVILQMSFQQQIVVHYSTRALPIIDSVALGSIIFTIRRHSATTLAPDRIIVVISTISLPTLTDNPRSCWIHPASI
jgi:hypothetical protein